MPPPTRFQDRLWTIQQRGVLLAFLVLLLALLSYRRLTRPTHLPTPLPLAGPRAAELPARLDPNTAPWEQLSLLPGLGEKKAHAIVDYRTQFQSTHSADTPAFQSPDDLTNIPGIGPATVASLSPHLVFPAASPTPP